MGRVFMRVISMMYHDFKGIQNITCINSYRCIQANTADILPPGNFEDWDHSGRYSPLQNF